MKKIGKSVLVLVLAVGVVNAGVVRLVTPPVVQKVGHFAKVHSKKARHFVWKVLW